MRALAKMSQASSLAVCSYRIIIEPLSCRLFCGKSRNYFGYLLQFPCICGKINTRTTVSDRTRTIYFLNRKDI